MTEIKSSLDIAMERAAAMGAAADDQAREDGRKAGKSLARRFLSGEIDTDRLTAELGGLDSGWIAFARTAATERMWPDLEQGMAHAVAGLVALAGGTEAQAAAAGLADLAESQQQAELVLLEQLSMDLAKDLAASGIGGSAVTPNPGAHPELTSRHDRIVAERADERASLLGQVREILLED